MSLPTGSRIGVFEITGSLGAGGMGEVYRARDTALGRDVALKVLPQAFANDPDRLARFAREAQALAALNHPHIAQIYGLEQAGTAPALVLELVEGPTIADVISARGTAQPIPVSDTIAIARQIALALEAAHNAGIVHRDLKPANIKLRVPDGAPAALTQLDVAETTVKVLDFGLAKALSNDPTSGVIEISNSPTLTNRATALGVILGTAAYMAPEQARGKAVDKRADVWAFGVVIFEMLTGRRVFHGDEATDVLAQVLTAEPDWKSLPADTPPSLKRLLRRCLEKDPKKRLRDIGDARIELDDTSEPMGAESEPAARTKRGTAWLGWAAAAALAAGLGYSLLTRPAPAPAPAVMQFTIDSISGMPVGADFAVSPDGTTIATVTAPAQEKPAIWVRSLNSLDARRLPGTEGAADLFWSPDSLSIGFASGGMVKHVKVATGVVTAVCKFKRFGGGAWDADNAIVYSDVDGLYRCGDGKAITTLSGDIGHLWPVVLPDGRHILYLAQVSGRYELRLVAIDGSATQVITTAESNALIAPGHLLYTLGDRLVAQPFDVDARRTTGDPIPLTDTTPGIVGSRRKAHFSVSSGGMLVYRLSSRPPEQLTWFDRNGVAVGKVGEPSVYTNMNLDPSGRRLAVSRLTGSPPNPDIWLVDFDRDNQFTRLTDFDGSEHDPAWSPDGRMVLFNSNRKGPYSLYRKPADPSATEEMLSDAGWVTTPEWSAGAKAIFYTLLTPARDLWVMPTEGERKARPFLATKFDERDPAPSPDGKFVAYESDASGRREIYVRPYPAGEPAVPVSTAGGTHVRWRGDGKEIVFVSLDGKMMGAMVETAGGLRISPPKELFPVSLTVIDGHPYAVRNDGRQFLIRVRPTDVRPTPLTVVTRFLESATR